MSINYQKIAAKFTDKGIHVFEKGTTGYNDSIRHVLQSSSQPSAFAVQPLNVDQLVETIKILGENKVPFGIKGGGTSKNPGFSSTEGVQIYMTFFDKIDLSNKGYIDIGAGSLWGRVYAALENSGQNVVGSTDSNGGVAGFLLHGGYSLKSNQYGLGIDNILEMEVVLPDGRVMTVKGDGEGSDLFEVLKGGGNNFGIVTRFRLRTHDQGPTWGGAFMFESRCESEVTTAIDTFVREETRREETHRENSRSESALVAAFRYSVNGGEPKYNISVTCVYDGPKPYNDPWASFASISKKEGALVKDQSNQMRTTNGIPYVVNQLSEIKSYAEVNAMTSETLPTPQNHNTRGWFGCIMVHSYNKTLIDAIASETKAAAQGMMKHGGRSVLLQVWPFVASIFNDSKPAAWPHPRDRALGPLLAYFLWEGQENDNFWFTRMKNTLDNVKEVARREGCTYDDAPIYPAVAFETTNAEEIYRENLDKLVAVRKVYDPDNIMLIPGGIKIPLLIKKPILPRKTMSLKKGEHGRQLLKRYDTVIIVDDSSSMCEDRRWDDAQEILLAIVDVAAHYDSDGIDLLFLNSTQHGVGLKSSAEVEDICRKVNPDEDATPLGTKLDAVLQKYIDDVKVKDKGSNKGLNLIVITDGEIEADTNEGVNLESVIARTAQKIVDERWNFKKIGINFVQVGNSEEAAELFGRLDNNPVLIHGKNGDEECDIVDYTPYTAQTFDDDVLNKMLLGGISDKFDNDRHIKV